MLHSIDQKMDEEEQRIANVKRLRQELIELRRDAQYLPVDDVEDKECVCHLLQTESLIVLRFFERSCPGAK